MDKADKADVQVCMKLMFKRHAPCLYGIVEHQPFNARHINLGVLGFTRVSTSWTPGLCLSSQPLNCRTTELSSAMLSTYKSLATLLLVSKALGCPYFNATLEDNKLSVYGWDDANNNNATNPEDIICKGDNLNFCQRKPVERECSRADNAESDTEFDVFLEPTMKRFSDIIYRYFNPNAADLQMGDSVEEFLFNFRVASVDGRFFKSGEFCAQYAILRLINPDGLKNLCDSLDSRKMEAGFWECTVSCPVAQVDCRRASLVFFGSWNQAGS